jgi:hypothetical protein
VIFKSKNIPELYALIELVSSLFWQLGNYIILQRKRSLPSSGKDESSLKFGLWHAFV